MRDKKPAKSLPSYEVYIHVEINGLRFDKTVWLPFVPFVGLSLAGAAEPFIVKQVIWDMLEDYFAVYCEPQTWTISEVEIAMVMQSFCWDRAP